MTHPEDEQELLLDLEAWDTPRRLSLDDAWAQTGGRGARRSLRDPRLDDEHEDDQ